MGKRFTEDQLVLIKEICSEVVARCMEYGLKKIQKKQMTFRLRLSVQKTP